MGGLDACITGTPLWRRMTFVVAPKDAFLSPHGMRILYRLTVFFYFYGSGRQRNRRSLAADILYRDCRNGTKFVKLIEGPCYIYHHPDW